MIFRPRIIFSYTSRANIRQAQYANDGLIFGSSKELPLRLHIGSDLGP